MPNMTDYDEERRRFVWDPPARFNFARDVIDRWAEQPELQALMASMGQSQAAEIQQMQGWYQSWYGGAPASPKYITYQR